MTDLFQMTPWTPNGLRRSAHFPFPGIRRRLSRDWSKGPRALVIGCNPSTADAEQEDPTTKWWNRWFQANGFGGYDAANLYSFCTSSPAKCRHISEAGWDGCDWGARDEMQHNRDAVAKMAKRADQVFVCWGAIAWDDAWIEDVIEEIQCGVAPYPDLWCWGKTKHGSPTHPMARGKHRIDPLQPAILWRAAT